jgi:hypothetical protein
MGSRNDQRRSEASAETHGARTPVDTPAVAAPTPEERAWEATALELKSAGYNASVVARKLIDQHGAPPATAQAIAARLFGKPVNAFAGDTTSAVVSGIGFSVVGVVGVVLLFALLDDRFERPRGLLLVFPLAALGFGLKRILFALVNRNVPPGEA